MMHRMWPFVIAIALWALAVELFSLPHFIFPGPDRVATVLIERHAQLAFHASVTGAEILAGLTLGGTFGFATGCLLSTSSRLQRATLPFLVMSQALPVFALAPLLMLWFGYGFASKLAMTTLIVYFPVTAATLAGFRRVPDSWIDTFVSLHAKPGPLFWRVRLPMALPHALSGLRIAASVAPIGAVVGEWVGSSSGLGYLMLHANGRGQTDLMFAALGVLCIEALVIWSLVSRLTRRLDQKFSGPSVA